jgi:hypothetical protein
MGSVMAAAWGTGMLKAISGTASMANPEAKPLLDNPISSAAGMAKA